MTALFYVKMMSFFGRNSNRTVHVMRSAQPSAKIAVRARGGGGDAALYPAQNDGKTIIVENDYNAQPAGYI